jgi:hypothetical protein
MSVPCLAQAGKLTGERRYYDDAARQILQFAQRIVREGTRPVHARLGAGNERPSRLPLGACERLGHHGDGRSC